ncbi:hypothetical protein HAX54_050201 [Datura stramonium]|uniref:Uncharacterized protein n=1 Tax=Datura stramonium TaxID=4076 RepID=A0ABS8SWN6_DATST|nr:hypothetical protein [Datura stramonium]
MRFTLQAQKSTRTDSCGPKIFTHFWDRSSNYTLSGKLLRRSPSPTSSSDQILSGYFKGVCTLIVTLVQHKVGALFLLYCHVNG